jgi:hypothetical protein
MFWATYYYLMLCMLNFTSISMFSNWFEMLNVMIYQMICTNDIVVDPPFHMKFTWFYLTNWILRPIEDLWSFTYNCISNDMCRMKRLYKGRQYIYIWNPQPPHLPPSGLHDLHLQSLKTRTTNHSIGNSFWKLVGGSVVQSFRYDYKEGLKKEKKK